MTKVLLHGLTLVMNRARGGGGGGLRVPGHGVFTPKLPRKLNI